MRKQNSLNITLWFLLAAMWSSSYAVIKIGVSNLDPSVLVLGRLFVGSVVIYAVLKLRKMVLSKDIRDWVSYTITGLLGSALPFLLITFGEQTVDSALASILIGVAPMATLVLAAAIVPEETLTLRTTLGVLGGLCGVVILVGPTALAGIGEHLIGQLAIVGATLCYAASTVYIRRFVKRPALEMATGSMIVGTLFMTGFVILSDADIGAIEPTMGSLGAILYLGLFSTACANLIYFFLVPRLGATRMSQVNFAVPVGGALLGVLLLNEAMTIQRFAALAIIISSVYLGTTNGRRG
ncbi:DMT family transporter [Heliomarina baculiformis]|uniref:DMT family transporter n=1 Tax=Heliomarina baculiformis TaxID=2872036 RepID=UPI001EE32838|nr:DMT family transporter [Heliomarina baculiformis]